MAQFAYNSMNISTTKRLLFYANYMLKPEAYRESIKGPEAQLVID